MWGLILCTAKEGLFPSAEEWGQRGACGFWIPSPLTFSRSFSPAIVLSFSWIMHFCLTTQWLASAYKYALVSQIFKNSPFDLSIPLATPPFTFCLYQHHLLRKCCLHLLTSHFVLKLQSRGFHSRHFTETAIVKSPRTSATPSSRHSALS